MKIGVSLKILQEAIEQQRLYQGQKGKYLDCTVFIDIGPADQYDQHGMITQDVTKDEKTAGVKGPILGNCKVFWCDDQSVVIAGNASQQHAPAPQAAPAPAPMAAPAAPQAPVMTRQDILITFQGKQGKEAADAYFFSLSAVDQDNLRADLQAAQ